MANTCCNGGSGSFPDANTLKNLARNNAVVYTEIAELQKAIFDAINPCKVDPNTGLPINNEPTSCVNIRAGTPMTWNSEINEVVINSGGNGYFPVTAEVTFVHPIGAGAAAEVIVSNGSIIDFNILSGGIGYDIIYPTLDLSVQGGSNGDIVLHVDPTTGAIVGSVIINQGSGYSAGTVPVVQTGGSGSGAIITIDVGGSGEITYVNILDGGTGYFPVTTEIIINHPTGQGFSGNVVVDSSGAIDSIIITSGGILYSPLLPQIVITDIDGGGFGAELLPTIDPNTGEIVSVDIVNGGFGYSSNLSVDVIPAPTSSGSGASITVSTNENPYNTDVYKYYLSISGGNVDCYYTDQIDQILCYFRGLGYTIDVNVNPDSNISIMWTICWC